MEDIKFHKFACYILNCLEAPNNQYVYVDGKYYESKSTTVSGSTTVKLIEYNKLNSIISSDADFTNFAELKDTNVIKNIKLLLQIKSYIKLQYVPDYIVKGSDATKLDIKQSIYQIFNILKTSFDAKKWYIDSNFTPNKPSPQNTVQLTRQFIGGALTYEQFLISVINAFISLLDGVYKSDNNKLTMYVLTKINYYIAKQYVKLAYKSLTDKDKKDTTPYNNSDFNDLNVYDGEYKTDDSEYEKYYQKEMLDTMNIQVNKTKDKTDVKCSDLFTKANFTVVRLFNTIKPFLKKQPTVFYQTPITTYTYNPTNIRPLIYRRASEYDLSNFATQIASDAFLNKNKLPVIYDFEKVMEPVTKASATGAVGGCSDVNNSSNVYRTIYVKILNMLNAKRITLNNGDKNQIEKKLNELEQLESELKEQLGDYAKYVSATQDKDTTIEYSKVKQFLNEYEDKIKQYNINSAKIVRFISRLTPYLY